jgi:hypothetical protein
MQEVLDFGRERYQGWLLVAACRNGEVIRSYTGTFVGSRVQFHTWWVCGVFDDSLQALHFQIRFGPIMVISETTGMEWMGNWILK